MQGQRALRPKHKGVNFELRIRLSNENYLKFYSKIYLKKKGLYEFF